MVHARSDTLSIPGNERDDADDDQDVSAHDPSGTGRGRPVAPARKVQAERMPTLSCARRTCVITAIVLCTVDRRHIPETTQALLAVEEVSEVYSVAGDWDIVAMIRVREHEQLAAVVTQKLASIATITRTTTLIAFRAYSNYDLERLFSVGADEGREA
jgi:DNA-binding Lrp family transcriptional regulator